MDRNQGWTLNDELDFISKLGYFTNRYDRSDLLLGYAASLDRRANWDNLPQERVRQAVQVALARQDYEQ